MPNRRCPVTEYGAGRKTSSLPISLNHPRNWDDTKSAASKLAPGKVFHFLLYEVPLRSGARPWAPCFEEQPSTTSRGMHGMAASFPSKIVCPGSPCRWMDIPGNALVPQARRATCVGKIYTRDRADWRGQRKGLVETSPSPSNGSCVATPGIPLAGPTYLEPRAEHRAKAPQMQEMNIKSLYITWENLLGKNYRFWERLQKDGAGELRRFPWQSPLHVTDFCHANNAPH